MTVAAVLGFLIYKLQIALAHGRRVRESKDFRTPGVAFGTMTVAAVVGFQIYNLQIALAQADWEF